MMRFTLHLAWDMTWEQYGFTVGMKMIEYEYSNTRPSTYESTIVLYERI